MKLLLVIFVLFLGTRICLAQTFPNGTTAIHKDSSIIVSWATSAAVERGYINISDTSATYTESGTTSNKAWNGTPENAIGIADGQFVSLGDSGTVVLQFNSPIINGNGADFAIFENAIFSPPTQQITAFIELAFVEVSSDGINFERFPALSSCQFVDQIGGFEAIEWNLFENFAGIYPVFYGTPFDLDDIEGSVVDKNHITHIRLVDVIGNIDPDFASHDSEGNIVNDAWPTAFATCGFDLDAVGVIHSAQPVEQKHLSTFQIYPNPVKDYITISTDRELILKIIDFSGNVVIESTVQSDTNTLDLSHLKPSVYIIFIYDNQNQYSQKLVKID